jgi:hypothetical protein
MNSDIIHKHEVYEIVATQTYLIIRFAEEEVVEIAQELTHISIKERGAFAEFYNRIMQADYKIKENQDQRNEIMARLRRWNEKKRN